MDEDQIQYNNNYGEYEAIYKKARFTLVKMFIGFALMLATPFIIITLI